MNFKRNLVCSLLGLLTVMVTVDANARDNSNSNSAVSADNGIIYKIHDIKPVIEQNEVVACDFGITFLNRTDVQVDNLSFDLKWTDKVIENKIAQEKSELNNKGKKTGKSKTEQFASKIISANVEVPHLPSKQQISVKGKASTDSCFLLADQPSLVFHRCNLAKGDKASSCDDLFYFISMQNDEYYNEFKEISYEVIRAKEEEKSIKAQKELNEFYNNTTTNMHKAFDTLNSIQ